ncbi:hypothetical protein C8B47_10740 [filamentous cyanobacterium CCP4]|nr:hypothetical protein C8B47_10740 [filamentous cyanobacterium CCP4]
MVNLMSEYELLIILLEAAYRADVEIVGVSTGERHLMFQIQCELGCQTFGYDDWGRVDTERMREIANNTMVMWNTHGHYELDCF